MKSAPKKVVKEKVTVKPMGKPMVEKKETMKVDKYKKGGKC
jgi:hypothetical protein